MRESVMDSVSVEIGRNLPSIVSRFEPTGHLQKDRWKVNILKEVFRRPGVTRKQLSKELKVRSETVSLTVGDLIKDGLISEGESIPGKPGRPEIELLPVGDRIVALSIYVEDRDIVMGVINLTNEASNVERHTLPANAINRDFETVIRSYIARVMSELSHTSEVAGVGISLIGAVDQRKNVWLSSARWRQMKDMDLSWLSDTLKVPMTVQRSLDAELDYILSVRQELHSSNAMLFHWGFGVGSAFSYKGQILGSSFGRFGDIGHTPVNKANGKQCLCGLRGCLETEAAFWALEGPILEEASPGTRVAEIMHDPRLADIPAVDKAIDSVANGLRTSFHLFFPDYIVLIGLFIENEVVASRLKSRFFSGLPTDCQERVTVSVERSAFGGVFYSSCSSLMLQALSKYSQLDTRVSLAN